MDGNKQVMISSNLLIIDSVGLFSLICGASTEFPLEFKKIKNSFNKFFFN